uniref:CUE domain-containing protein n=1 Tax=Kalmanozyma brasiliensis (strain GHG001) TaxID=1365824 RepID=V5ESH7_KALBG
MAADNALGPAQDSHHLVHSLARLSTSDLVRFTLQKPDVARVFAASLHQLAVEAASSPLPNVNEQQLGKSHVDILARLIERGDPSLARKFVPTQGSLVDLAVAAPADTTAAVAAILERLLDATSVKEIVSGLSAQFSGLVSTQDQQDAATLPSVIRTLARLSSAFLRVCPARLLKGNVALLQPWARTCVQIYDKILPQVARTLSRDGTTILSEPDSLNLEAQEWQLHWLTCRVDLLQLVSILLEYLRGSSKLVDASRESLADTEMLLKKGGFSTLLNSTVLLDLAATSESWPSLRSELSSSVTSKKGHNNGTIASVDTLATLVPKFTGAAWDALQRYVASQAPSPAKEIQEPAASSISEDVLASVDSILPHYGMDRLRVILSRPSFAGQNAELVIQRLLEGDEAPSLVKSRANLFGDFAFDPSTIVQPKLARSGKVDELAPELKAAIIARAEAADEEEAGEEWNPFAPARTVGVEDELDLDNDGRERTAPRRTTDDDEEDDEEEEARMRERVLLRHYVQHGSSAFSADASTRRSDGRQRLKQEAGMSDDLIESWAVMLDRNPRKDRLLAAASQSALDDQLASRISRNVSEAEDDDDGSQQRQWGPDRGRGGRILRGASRGGRGGGGRGGSASGGGGSGSGQSKNATRGRGTGNSGTDRSAKQKEKAGNKARQRGHDKKMARVNP